MKPILFLCVSVFCVVTVTAQCEPEPVLDKSRVIASETWEFNRSVTNASLSIKPLVANSSWGTKGAEAAVLTIFVDGKYNQDLVLFADGVRLKAGVGDGRYRVFIGSLDKGEHRADIVLNEKYSAPNVGRVTIDDVDGVSSGASPDLASYVTPVGTPRNSPEKTSFSEFRKTILGYANAPFIYARPNTIGKFSDIPLLTYFETFDEPNGVVRFRYTTIFSNEDGGTQSKALMARWGRLVDIEWVYEMRIDKDGKILDETYQGADHVTKKFAGKREFGTHPALYVVTDNNNFADSGCSPLRFAPYAFEADLSNGSRETMLERFPFIYRVMAEEAWREGRVVAGDKGANTIGDPRSYLYVEVYNEAKNAAIAIEAKLTSGEILTSDLGIPQIRVDRSGYKRIALELPAKSSFSDLESFSLWCYAKTPGVYSECRDLRLVKVITLDESYRPIQHPINMEPQTLTNGESAYHAMKKPKPAERKKKILVHKPI